MTNYIPIDHARGFGYQYIGLCRRGGDGARCADAIRLIEQLPAEQVLLPAQTLGELFRVLTGKARREARLTQQAIMAWADSFEVADSSWPAFQAAMDLSIDYRLQIWDALNMAVAAENRCRLLVSEDLLDGFIWRGVTVVDPFATPASPLLDKGVGNKYIHRLNGEIPK